MNLKFDLNEIILLQNFTITSDSKVDNNTITSDSLNNSRRKKIPRCEC
jgi:hypothetical protein